MRSRVLLADDHPLILSNVKDMLSPHFDVVGLVADGRTLVEEAKRLTPDIVVLDIHMPRLNGLEASRQITSLLPGTRLIFLTQQLDPNYMQAALRAGAMGFVAKQAATTELLQAIHAVLQNELFVTPLALSPVSDGEAGQGSKIRPADLLAARLNSTQREVLQQLANGRSAQAIAEALRISVTTVEFHKSMIMSELGVRTTAELTKYVTELRTSND